MVHLARVPTVKEAKEHLADEVKNVSFPEIDEDDTIATSVYGSRFAAQDIPRHEMPDREMPKEVAYRMIKLDSQAWP